MDLKEIDGLDAIINAWTKAKNPVVFTGAGMSTESGLPDFRSAQGLWKTRPENLATLTALKNNPNDFYYFYQWRIARLWDVSPNAGHLSLASMQQLGLINKLITQNVDGLHQRAGSTNVIELHGSLRTVSCMGCKSEFKSTIMLPARETWEEEYITGVYQYGSECFCPQCKGILRPDVVLFGEQLPRENWDDAVAASKDADFFVALGSSLTVSPANFCPQLALESGAKLLIINNEPTPLDDKATWVVNESIGDVLSVIATRMKRDKNI